MEADRCGSGRAEKGVEEGGEGSTKVHNIQETSERLHQANDSLAVLAKQMVRCTAMYLPIAVGWIAYLISLHSSSSTPTKEQTAAVKAAQREAELTPIAEAKKVHVSTQ